MKKKKVLILLLVFMLLGMLQITIFANEPVKFDENNLGPGIDLSNNNLTVTSYRAIAGATAMTNQTKSTGKWYWEVTYDEGNMGIVMTGIAEKGASNKGPYYSDLCKTYCDYNGGALYEKGTRIKEVNVEATVGDTIGVALDLDNGILEFYINGKKLNHRFDDVPLGKDVHAIIVKDGSSHRIAVTANFGVKPFKYEIPKGYLPYDTTAQITTNSLISVLLEVDETAQLSVTSNLEDNTSLMWSSMNEDVATVDKNGKVTAKGEGLTQIYAQNEDGSFKEYINIRVVAKGEAEELRLALNLNVGKSQRLYLNDDYENIEWTSQDKSIATIDKNGKVKAVSEGLVIINATYKDETQMIYVRVTE